MIPNYLTKKPTLLLTLACLIQWALLFAITTPAWDATFYYAYARSVVFDGDLRIENDLRLSYPTTAPDFAAREMDQDKLETGRVASPYALGSSLIWLPWLALLRLGTEIGQALGLLPAALNGYEWYFTAGLATLSMLLGWLAHWIGYRIARVEHGRFTALAAVLTVLFASPLIYYQYREPLYSHATAAFITGLVTLTWWRSYKKLPGNRQGVLLGGLIGLAALVRWQHLVYLALPAVSTAWWYFSNGDKRRGDNKRRELWPAARYLLIVGLAALTLLSLQLVQWRLFYGSWLTVPQGSAYVDWTAPFWQPVLFSTFRGIIPWMPLIPLAVVGLILMARRKPRLVLPLLLLLLLETYVNSSTRDWFGGAGFGPRRYTSELVILILGYAGLLQAIPGRIQKVAALAAGLALALHQWILLRFGLLEDIGGYNLSMYPTYEWVDGSYGEFWRAITGHLSDLAQNPFDFFVLPGSPIRLLSIGRFPTQHIAALIATLIFILFAWRFGRWLSGRIQRSWLVIGIIAALVITADLWLLLWG